MQKVLFSVCIHIVAYFWPIPKQKKNDNNRYKPVYTYFKQFVFIGLKVIGSN